LRQRLANCRSVREVRGLGLLLGVDIHSNGGNPADVAEQIMYAALRRGLNFKVSKGTVLTFAPPLNISNEALDVAWKVLGLAIGEVEKNQKPA
jgi:4-aminobutyrate aminotransferase